MQVIISHYIYYTVIIIIYYIVWRYIKLIRWLFNLTRCRFNVIERLKIDQANMKLIRWDQFWSSVIKLVFWYRFPFPLYTWPIRIEANYARHFEVCLNSFQFKINESRFIALFVVSGSIKKLFSIDYVNIYIFSIFFQ